MDEFLNFLNVLELCSPNEDGSPTEEELAEQKAKDEAEAKAEAKAKTKTFTQDEVNEIVSNRLGKEKAKMMKKFNIEDEAELDAIIERNSKYSEIEKELSELKGKELEREFQTKAKDLGVDEDFLDYVLTKVSKDDKFEENVKSLLEKNPKLKKESYQQIDSSLTHKNEPYPDFEKMTTEQYLAWRSKNKL